jgi:hypothetical protein
MPPLMIIDEVVVVPCIRYAYPKPTHNLKPTLYDIKSTVGGDNDLDLTIPCHPRMVWGPHVMCHMHRCKGVGMAQVHISLLQSYIWGFQM